MARVIHDDLGATLGEEAVQYCTVMWDLREARINPADATSLLETTSPRRIKRICPAIF
jgi:hypothetical protein